MLDAMRMRTACFAQVPQRWTSRLSKHFLLIFQGVTPFIKTRNQLIPIGLEGCLLKHLADVWGDGAESTEGTIEVKVCGMDEAKTWHTCLSLWTTLSRRRSCRLFVIAQPRTSLSIRMERGSV